jgi:uncharacterized membrane protein
LYKENVGNVIKQLQNSWQQFKEGSPGSRFQDRYHHRSNDSKLSKLMFVVVGLAMFLVGIVPIPFLPANGILAPLGLMVIAGEIELVARFLDWAELQARNAAQRAVTFWSRSSTVVRVLVVAAVVAAIATLGYGAYSLVTGG